MTKYNTEVDADLKADKRELSRAVIENGTQLDLFMVGSKASPTVYSNLIGLYDALPKFTYDKKEVFDLQQLEYERSVTLNKETMTVKIQAAVISRGSKKVAIFAGEREEFVDEALRKLAVSGGARLVNNRTGMEFSLYELQKELARTGHTYSFVELKEALLILRKTSITCISASNSTMFDTNLIDQLYIVSRSEWEDNADSKCIVRFNSVLHDAIFSLNFRQYNYELCMNIKSSLGRFIYKRMCGYWTQANENLPYTPNLVSFLKQSPKILSVRMGDNMRAMNKALDELIRKRVVSHYVAEKVTQGQRKIIDVKYSIYPHTDFVKDVKRSNKLNSNMINAIACNPYQENYYDDA